MTNSCEHCSQTYEAATARSRYCSDKCRRRHNYTGQAQRRDLEHVTDESIVATTQGYLEKINMGNSPRGLALLVLAERLENADRMSDAGLAAVQRQYDSTLDRIALDYSRTTRADDPIARIAAHRTSRLAELRAHHAKHRASGAG